MTEPKSPLFSIITVTLNAEETLQRAIDSIRGQTFRNYELIAIDGESTDGTLAILRANQDAITHFVSEKDQGISDAFNKGLALARGEWIGILSADDWYEPDALEITERQIHAVSADVYCGLQQYWRHGARAHLFDASPSLLTSSMSVNHAASFARRSLFVEHGSFKTNYRAAMDYELYLRFFQRGAKFCRVGSVLANVSLGGVSDRKWKLALQEVRQAQIENGVDRVAANCHYLFQLAKGWGRRRLEKIGSPSCQRIIDFYRRRVARVAKT